MGGRGGISGVSTGGGGGSFRKAEKKFAKWELPAAVEPAKLDTARFDEVASSLGLSSEQLAKIEAAKKEIRGNIDQLAKAQNEARSAYAGRTNAGHPRGRTRLRSPGCARRNAVVRENP